MSFRLSMPKVECAEGKRKSRGAGLAEVRCMRMGREFL
jgi:hypothetical protein